MRTDGPDVSHVPQVPADPDERAVPIVNAVQRALEVFQLLGGVLLVVLLDTKYALDIRAGAIYDPPWISYAIPIGLTVAWIVGAAFVVRHLWHEWTAWRAWKAWEKRQRLIQQQQRALSATSHPPQPPTSPQPPTAQP